MEQKFTIKEVWWVNEKGETTTKIKAARFDSPLDDKEIVYEGNVAVLKPKKSQ